MNFFARAIPQISKGAIKAFQTFPAAIASALGFAIVTMIRIQIDWPEQETYNFLFNCLHWAFALGAAFSLAAITAAQSRYGDERAFSIANLLGGAVVIVTFIMLYFFGGTDLSLDASRFARVSGIAVARVSVAIQVSFIAFIILAGYPKNQSDFSRSLFMTQKAFFIALIYGTVLMGGASGVAGAVQALIYREMSWKVYAYIGTLVGFFTFTIFVGYFPDFYKGRIDEKRETAQKQPQFIGILFEYIMIPIALALTAVLLIWAGKTVVTGMGASFVRLSGIATSYAAVGIWLHIMVTHNKSGLTKFYRRIYPFTALVILAFEAWALLVQLGKSGLKTTEYFFILTWIIAVAAAILLIMLKARAHTAIAALVCALAVFSVMPAVGYNALPVTSQVNRLEKLLVSQGMIEDGKLVPADSEPERTVRESITDAIIYLAGAEDAKLPAWFDRSLSQRSAFKTKLGFEQTWPEPEYEPGRVDYMATNLVLQPDALDISGYRWAVNLQGEKEGAQVTVEGDKGLYRIDWTTDLQTGIPTLNIELDDRVILKEDMNDYIDQIAEAFPPGQPETVEADLKDMSLKLETPEISVLLVFNSIQINVDPQKDDIHYWLDLRALYLKEKA